MALNLDLLGELGRSYGFQASMTAEQLDIELPDGLTLVFSNASDDETFGLRSGDWHVHPPWIVEVGGGFFREFEADDVLKAAADHQLLVIEIHKSGELADCWLEHCEGPVGARLEPDEEMRIRVAGGTTV